MERIPELEARIADFNARRRAWKWAPDNPLESLNEEIFGELDQVLRIYAEAQSAQRQYLRELLARHPAVASYLDGYLVGAIDRLGSMPDVKWLQQALLAASLSDMRGDYRDWIVLLGDLFLAAARAGIDPMPYFQWAATLSNPEDTDGTGSTQHFLENFDKSAHFVEAVRPKLAEP